MSVFIILMQLCLRLVVVIACMPVCMAMLTFWVSAAVGAAAHLKCWVWPAVEQKKGLDDGKEQEMQAEVLLQETQQQPKRTLLEAIRCSINQTLCHNIEGTAQQELQHAAPATPRQRRQHAHQDAQQPKVQAHWSIQAYMPRTLVQVQPHPWTFFSSVLFCSQGACDLVTFLLHCIYALLHYGMQLHQAIHVRNTALTYFIESYTCLLKHAIGLHNACVVFEISGNIWVYKCGLFQGAYNAQLAKTAELEARLLQKNMQLAQLNAQLVGMAQALGLIPVGEVGAEEFAGEPAAIDVPFEAAA